MRLGYRVLSTVALAERRRARVWLDPGVPLPVGPGGALVCFFDRQTRGFDLDRIRRLPVFVEDYCLRIRYESPTPGCGFDYEDVGASFIMSDAWLAAIPRVVESHPHGMPTRLLLDFYSLDTLARSVGL